MPTEVSTWFGNSNSVPLGGIPTANTLPHDPLVAVAAREYSWLKKTNSFDSPTVYGIRLTPASSDNKLKLRIIPNDAPPDPSRQVVKHRVFGLTDSVTLTPRAFTSYCYGSENMFKDRSPSRKDEQRLPRGTELYPA